jgi:hypothetical protein
LRAIITSATRRGAAEGASADIGWTLGTVRAAQAPNKGLHTGHFRP